MMALPAGLGAVRPAAGGPPPPTDPYWSFVTSLLHFDGADGSTTITDQVAGTVWTSVSSAENSTTLPKFGSGCLALNGSSQYLRNNQSPPWAVAGGDFTIEAWVRFASAIAARQNIFSFWLTTGFGFHVTDTGKLRGFLSSPATVSIEGATTISPGVYHHVAMVRDGSTLRIYLDGVQEASAAVTGNMATPSIQADLGAESASGGIRFLNGRIDDFRFTKGICRYPGGTTFAVPTAAFPNS